MKIALIGYGKMGHEIEKIALERGHIISVIIDQNNLKDFNSEKFRDTDVAIEFSTPSSALSNYKECFNQNIPIVSGTTGWLEHLEYIKSTCKKENKTFFYASNYSLGVNIFSAVNKYLAKIMNNYLSYNISMEETHHIHKLDAPSGTAISLLKDLIEKIDRKQSWHLEGENTSEDIAVRSIRSGEIPGIHEIKYESEADIITIKHDAKNRKGFALGAVMAAEFLKGKKGYYTMQDMLRF